MLFLLTLLFIDKRCACRKNCWERQKQSAYAGAEFFAISPASSVTAPPKTKRVAYSLHVVRRIEPRLSFTIILYWKTAQRPMALANHNKRHADVVRRTFDFFRMSSLLTIQA